MPTLTLKGLYGQFVRYSERGGDVYLLDVQTLADAQGVSFLCPRCFAANGGRVTTHAVVIWFANRDVPDWARPVPARYKFDGTGIEDLTISPQVSIGSGCDWTGFIQCGNVYDR